MIKHSALKLFITPVKKTWLSAICFLAVFFFVFSGSLQASSLSEYDVVRSTRERITEIYKWKISEAGASDLQDLIDTSFCDDPLSSTNQYYILSIIQNPYISADLSKYISALSDALDGSVSSGEGIYPTTLQKSLSTLVTCLEYEKKKAGLEDIASYNPENIYTLKDHVSSGVLETACFHTIGEKGIMSYIWGLDMLDTCGFRDASFSRKEVIEKLISLQCADGGFTIAGDVGDVDVTAMVLQVLAGDYRFLPLNSSITLEEASRLRNCVDSALGFLSEKQLASGDCEGFGGSACSESTAQTILALTALCRDPLTDEKFIRSGNTLPDGLMIYSNDDGGFSHTAGTPSNDMATSQVLNAMTQIISGDDKKDNSELQQNVIPAGDLRPDITAGKAPDKSIFPYRIVIPAVILAAALAYGLFFTLKKKKIIRLISAVVVAALAIGIFFAADIRSKTSFENAGSTILLSEGEASALRISFTISAYTVSEGEIYPEKTLYVADGSTVFDVLSEICRTEHIQFDYESSSVYGLAYIKGINSIYEYDHGDLSGWMYRVNGEMPNIGVGYYKLKDGDNVEILYSTNIGRDLDD